MGANPKVAKKLLEPFCHADVVISTHHAYQQTLAESSRTYKEESVCLFLQQRQIHSLIDIILVSLDNIDEIRYSVWYSFSLFHDE